MSVTLKIDNFSTTNLNQQTILTADVAPGATSLSVLNSAGYNAGDYIVVGLLASDQSEALKVLAISDARTITTTTPVQLPHAENDSVWSIYGNQIQIYAAANVNRLVPADTAFSVVGTPINISAWNAYTVYNDTTPGQFWYKFSYHNSVTGYDSGITGAAAQLSGTVQYCSLFDIREKAGLLNNPYITDSQVEKYRRRAQKEIDNRLQSLYDVPFTYPVNEEIEDVTAQLAAGMLLDMDNAVMASGTKAEATDKLADARKTLAEIDNRSVVLTDANGSPLILEFADSVQSWPNASTQYLNETYNGSPRMFYSGHNF